MNQYEKEIQALKYRCRKLEQQCSMFDDTFQKQNQLVKSQDDMIQISLLRRTYCNTDKSIPSPGRTLPDTGRDHPADEKRPDQIIQCAQEKAR